MTEDTVTGNFVRPCLTCGNTVRVVDTVEQPHHCEAPGPVAELVARAWWAGYYAARSAAPSGEQRKEGQRVGICGNRSPSAFGTSEVCTLPHGHGGWHEADADLGLSPMRWSSFGGVQRPGSETR